MFLSLSPLCLSQGSTNEVSGSCSLHAAWEQHPGPKSTLGLLQGGSQEGSGPGWLWGGCGCGHCPQEPRGAEIGVRMAGHDWDFQLCPISSVGGFSCCARTPRWFWCRQGQLGSPPGWAGLSVLLELLWVLILGKTSPCWVELSAEHRGNGSSIPSTPRGTGSAILLPQQGRELL